MRRKYTKPTFRFVEIQTNELCIGSQQKTAIPVQIKKMNKERVKYKHSFKSGETCDMWETDF